MLSVDLYEVPRKFIIPVLLVLLGTSCSPSVSDQKSDYPIDSIIQEANIAMDQSGVDHALVLKNDICLSCLYRHFDDHSFRLAVVIVGAEQDFIDEQNAIYRKQVSFWNAEIDTPQPIFVAVRRDSAGSSSFYDGAEIPEWTERIESILDCLTTPSSSDDEQMSSCNWIVS